MSAKRAVSPSQMVNRVQPSTTISAATLITATLVDRCRMVIIKHVERYPPEAFGVCDCDEWQTLIRLRHTNTQPKRRITSGYSRSPCANGNSSGNGGIDGTGRLVPAVLDKVILAIEVCNPHLSDSPVVDTLIWKDCVEYKFRKGASGALLLSRPVALFSPWPLMVQEIQRQAEHLSVTSSLSPSVVAEAIDALRQTPMNVALLRDSGVGKLVKKAIKKVDATNKEQLETLLEAWMNMAANDGVLVGTVPHVTDKAPKHDDTTRADLELAERCRCWRDLFMALQHRNEKIRSKQGKRMREIRRNLAKTRPKLVKVRPTASAQQSRLLERDAAASGHRPSGKNAMVALRKETTIRTERQKSSAVVIRPKSSSFGDAVAFASVSKKGMAHKRKRVGGTIQNLGNGKRMKVPTEVVQGAGPRQFASKWKSTGTKKEMHNTRKN